LSRVALHRSRSKSPHLAGRALPVSLLAAGIALAGSAAYVQWRSRRAERSNPPSGKFVIINGARIHYTDTGGPGPVVVLLHGNGSMIIELESSGIIGKLASRYRVLTFDRPGFGYSDRPRSVSWTPAAQADLVYTALRRLGVARAIVLGHSWGTLVAIEMALRHPELVQGLLLVAGFYFPVWRKDVALLSMTAVPIIGDILRYTLSPLVAKALAPSVIRKSFAPRAVSERFAGRFPIDLALRPLNLRASAEDLALMLPAAAALEPRYKDIRHPAIIVAGSGDAIIDVNRQSVRLHQTIPGSELYVLPNDGHMVHHHAPLTIVQSIDKLAASARSPQAATSSK
jgi:pimeloyl-ACP methyl ester carboxylesterase